MDMDFDALNTRDIPITPHRAALLFIDVQNFSAHRNGSEFKGLSDTLFAEQYAWFFHQLEHDTLPKMVRVQSLCRRAGVEVMHTVIENLTRDGRDRSLDYRITGFNVPKGSWDAQVLDPVKPVADEMVFSKTASNVFISTNIDYVLRNMAIRQLIIGGIITDQCVSSAVRQACDLGYLVTLVSDACTTYSQARQTDALSSLSGYCQQLTTDQLADQLT